MDPAAAQEITQRLVEMEASLAEMKTTFPLIYAAASAVLIGVLLALRELFVRYAGLPAKTIEALATAVSGRVEAAADAFLKTKATNFARKEDLKLIVDEVTATRKATAQIEQEFANRKFVSERTYDFAAKAVEQLIQPLFVCLEGHERLLASVKADREEREIDGPPITLPKLSSEERVALYEVCGTKHNDFRRARAMAPVVLGAEVVEILSQYDIEWNRLHSIPWEQWEDDEEGHLERIVGIEKSTYENLCDAARRPLVEERTNA